MRLQEGAMFDRVANFYDGKSVLLTGATGFLGGVLLEILLRCCPGLKAVYVVLREKKGVSPKDRKSIIFDKLIFTNLRKEHPEVLNKVQIVSGNITSPDFGIPEHELPKILSEVSIVFQCAATIRFNKSLLYTLTNNVLSLKYAIEFCRKLQKLDVLVYTSTAFSNVNKPLKEIEEIIYRLPYRGERYLQAIEKNDIPELEYLAANSGHKFPNAYTFSKCIAENVIADCAGDLTVAIVRPSIIITTWKGSRPGYVEPGSGIVTFCVGVAKGFIRVVRSDPNLSFDVIPCDIVSNAHILAAFKAATEKYDGPLVVNSTTRRRNRMTMNEFKDVMMKVARNRPIAGSLQLPSVVYHKHALSYWATALLEHYGPAVVFDSALRLMGKKPKLVKLYRFFELAQIDMHFFMMNDFEQADDNLRALINGLHKEDAETFNVIADSWRLKDTSHGIPDSFPIFKDQKDNERKLIYLRSGIAFFIKHMMILLFLLLFYYILKQLLSFIS